MLSELRETNKKLRKKLKELRNESTKLCGDTERYLNATNAFESSFGLPVASSSRKHCTFDSVEVPTTSYARRSMLSDRAKYVRGEASRRIDSLLNDWRDYKDRAEEELRRRCREEQSLREMLTRKERELEDMSSEITSLRLISIDQKKSIDRLTEELEKDAKCRAKCAELELQISRLNRYITELHGEIQVRDELVKSSEAERQNLLQINGELKERNQDQKNKIESCEKDVTETKMELEILEEMVRALNERKTFIFSNSERNSLAPTPNTAVDFNTSVRHYSTPVAQDKAFPLTPPPNYKTKDDVIPLSFSSTIVNGASQEENKEVTGSSSGSNGEDRDRQLSDRISAMSALKSLQKEHAEKCNYLAEHIRKLKSENKEKEKTICALQNQTKKTAP